MLVLAIAVVIGAGTFLLLAMRAFALWLRHTLFMGG